MKRNKVLKSYTKVSDLVYKRRMNKIHAIFIALKRHLKARRISYSELARRTQMSEANVKRIFSEETCSLTRLDEICEAVGLPLAELMRSAAELSPEYYILPREADKFFVGNMDYFVCYRELQAGLSVRDLREKNGLSAIEMNRYLKKLEELGLIERLPGDEIRFMHSGYLRFPSDSRLPDKFFRSWVPRFFERVMTSNQKHYTKIFSTGLSERNRMELERDLEDLAKKYHERGYFDQRMDRKSVEAVGVCIGLGPYRVGDGKLSDYRG